MNAHHKDCECRLCAIGREIGMDEALELISESREIVRSLRIKNKRTDCAIAWADTFLAKHSGEQE